MKRVLTIVITIALICGMTACGQKTIDNKDENSTNSLLVNADKENVGYIEESEDTPAYGDTDYKYVVSKSEESEAQSEVVSSETSEPVSSKKAEGGNSGNGDNGGGGNTPKYDPEKYRPVSPLADSESVDLSTFSVFNGNEVNTYDFNELAGMPIDEFVEKTGFTLIKDNVYEGPLSEEDCCVGSSGYYTMGENSPIVYVETYMEETKNEKGKKEEKEAVSAILFPEVMPHDSASYIKIGGENGLKLAPDAYSSRLDDAFGNHYQRIISSDGCYARIYHDEDVFVYFHYDEEAFVKEVFFYKSGLNYRH